MKRVARPIWAHLGPGPWNLGLGPARRAFLGTWIGTFISDSNLHISFIPPHGTAVFVRSFKKWLCLARQGYPSSTDATKVEISMIRWMGAMANQKAAENENNNSCSECTNHPGWRTSLAAGSLRITRHFRIFVLPPQRWCLPTAPWHECPSASTFSISIACEPQLPRIVPARTGETQEWVNAVSGPADPCVP